MILHFRYNNQNLPVPKQIRVLINHPVHGPVEGLFEAEGNGNAYIRVPDYLIEDGDYVGIRNRTQFGLDSFAPYLICQPSLVIFLS